MAGIGDSWGTKDELLHPRGPDGRWIRKAGVAKSIIQRVLDALGSFRPRMFQNQSQANQYLRNVASKKPGRFNGGRGYSRLLSDLGPTNEDLRDGVIDNPSTSRFIKMMDDSSTELPDDVILSRTVGVDAFGFTPQTAQGTSSDADPGIRGLSGKLVADRGYSTTVIGQPRGAAPQGSVRMVIAARKGTKVIVPGSGQEDSTIFLDRDQPLRITKIQPDGSGGWVMYAMTDEKRPREVPAPIGGPVGAGVRDTKKREATIREGERIQAAHQKRPDDEAEAADEEQRRIAAEEAAGRPVTPSPMQDAERRRIELLQQQAGVQPRTEPIQARSIGGEPRPETAPGGQPQAPEAPAPQRRVVDLRLAVRDAGIRRPEAGKNRKQWNDAYEGIISGKKDPIDAAQELERDADDLDAMGHPDGESFRQLSELIQREYGTELPPAKKTAPVPRTAQGLPKITKSQLQEMDERQRAAKAGKAGAPEAPPAPTPVKAPAKQSGMSPDQEARVVARARQFRGAERNDEERRIVGQADEILARRRGEATPEMQATKALRAPAKMAPAKKAAPEAPGEDLDKMTKAELLAEAERRGVETPKSWNKDKIKQHLRDQEVHRPVEKTPEQRREQRRTDQALERQFQEREAAGEAVPQPDTGPAPEAPAKKAAKAVPKKLNSRNLSPGDRVIWERPGELPVHGVVDRQGTRVFVNWEGGRRERVTSTGDGGMGPDVRLASPEEIKEHGTLGPPREEAPTPAKAAVPGAAPGTAAGKITAGRLKVGDQVLVSQNNVGGWVPSTRKTGQTRLTIEGIGQAPGRSGIRRTTTRLVLTGRDENGNEIQVASVPGHQTFIVAPEPGAAPAKKAAKAAAPKRMTIGEARRLSAVEAIRANEVTGNESNSWKTILSRVDSGEWSVARARKEAKDSARYWRESATTVRRGAGRSDPKKVEEAASRLERAADKYDKLAEDLTISQSVTKTDKFMDRPPAKKPVKGLHSLMGLKPGESQHTDQILEPLVQVGPGQGGVIRAVPEGPAPEARKLTPSEVLGMLSGQENPMGRNEATRLVSGFNKAQLQEMAKELEIPRRTSLTKPELQREIVEATVGRRRDSIAIRGFTEGRPELAPPLPDVDPVEEARNRQAKIDRAKKYGRLGAELDELITNGATPEAISARVRTRLGGDGQDPAFADAIDQMIQAGDTDGARAFVNRIMTADDISLQGKAGDVVPFDRRLHRGIAGDIPDGTMVHITRPGHSTKWDGEDIPVERATVEVAAPDEVSAKVGRTEVARKAVPKGSVKGDRPQAPIDNEPRKRTFTEAWDAAELGVEGSPGRSMKEIRDDVASGKITPEEGIRRLEDEIAFNKEDIAEIDANLRQPDLSDAERTKLQSNAAVLQNGVEAQQKASKFMRMYFRDEKPTVKEVEVNLDAEGFKALQEATPDTLREAAKQSGFDPPKGETKDEILQDLIRQVAGRVVRDRAAKKAPAKKAVKAAKKAAPQIPTDREKLDVRTIGAGIEFGDDKWTRSSLEEAQQGLDAGESPASVGRKLETSAQVHRNRATIHHGSWAESLRDPSDPDEAGRMADDRRVHDMLMADADRMQELADRLKATRRRPAKKAAAPEVQAAETRADTVEARLINEHLERLNSARTRDQGNAALEGLTMPELRRIGEQMGVKGRSKQELRDKILDRFVPEVQTPEARAELEGRQGQVLERLGRQAAPSASAPLSRRARDAGIEPPARSFSGVDSGVGEADRRLKAGQSPTEVSRFLRERASQVAKADLNEEGRRFTTIQDKDTLKSIRKQSAEYLRRVATHIQQEGKAERPAKKTAPSAPSPAAPPRLTGLSPHPPVSGERSTAPEIKNNWGMLGTGGEVEFHDDGVVGQALRSMRDDRLMDVDGEPLSNVVGKWATRAIRGDISQEQFLDELRRLEQRLPEGSAARRGVGIMIKGIDAPERKVDIPPGTLPPIATLIRSLLRIPLTREAVNRPGFHRSRENSEVDKVLKLLQEFQEGRTGGLRFIGEFQNIRRNLPHESQEGRFEADRALRRVVEELQALYKEDRRSLMPQASTRS